MSIKNPANLPENEQINENVASENNPSENKETAVKKKDIEKKKKKEKKKFSFNSKEDEVTLDIPEDQIWEYRIEGLAPPHVNKPYKHYSLKKFIFTVTIIVAVSLSMYFSVRTVQSDTLEYEQLDSGWEFSNFSNNGSIKEVYIDYVSDIEYDTKNADPATNFEFVKDESKVVTSVREYAFNCDNIVEVIHISENVEKIEGTSFYSCWNLQRIEVDENNPYYCDIDGVLYNKDKTELILYPIDHDKYLRSKTAGSGENDYTKLVGDDGKSMEELWGTTQRYDEAYLEQYNKTVRTFVVPSTVKTLGELSLAYANITDLYLPEGLERIETMSNFKNTVLLNVYSYTATDVIEDQSAAAINKFDSVYKSLPNGLEYIGSDAFSYDRGLTYVFIPKSVTHIGHHAYWDTCYKDGDVLTGIASINYEGTQDELDNVEKGNSWLPEYDWMLFKKKVDINYSAQREEMSASAQNEG